MYPTQRLMGGASQHLQFSSKLTNWHHPLRWSSKQRCLKLAILLKAELIDTINKCNNSLTSSLNKLLWSHLKAIIKDDYINKLIDIANTCTNLGYWPSHFKTSTMIIISKLKKISYDSTKSFFPIVLLNTTGKLFKKMIGEYLQFLLISNNIHSY